MRKNRFLALIFGLMLSVSGYSETSILEHLLFQGTYYKDFFPKGGLALSPYANTTYLNIMQLGAAWEQPVWKGLGYLGLEAGYSSGSKFGGSSSMDFIPIMVNAGYDIPLGDFFSVGPNVKLGGYSLFTPIGNRMVPVIAGHVEGEFRYKPFPLSLYAAGGVDFFPTASGVLPAIEVGTRFRPYALFNRSGSKEKSKAAASGQAAPIVVPHSMTVITPHPEVVVAPAPVSVVTPSKPAVVVVPPAPAAVVTPPPAPVVVAPPKPAVVVTPPPPAPVVAAPPAPTAVVTPPPAPVVVAPPKPAVVVAPPPSAPVVVAPPVPAAVVTPPKPVVVVTPPPPAVVVAPPAPAAVVTPPPAAIVVPPAPAAVVALSPAVVAPPKAVVAPPKAVVAPVTVASTPQVKTLGGTPVVIDGRQCYLRSVYFHPDSDAIIDASRSSLDAVGREMTADSSLRLLLRAYTTPAKTPEGRFTVSVDRAAYCQEYLYHRYGISSNRITSYYYGSDRAPLMANGNLESLRCVELLVR